MVGHSPILGLTISNKLAILLLPDTEEVFLVKDQLCQRRLGPSLTHKYDITH